MSKVNKISRSLIYISQNLLSQDKQYEFVVCCRKFGYEFSANEMHINICQEDINIGPLEIYAFINKLDFIKFTILLKELVNKIFINKYTLDKQQKILNFILDEFFIIKHNDNLIEFLVSSIMLDTFISLATNLGINYDKSDTTTNIDYNSIDKTIQRRINTCFIDANIEDSTDNYDNYNNQVFGDSLRELMLNLGFHEVLTMPIINEKNTSPLEYNIIDGFLSYNYMRHSITDSWIKEFESFKKYSKSFEISYIYDVQNKHTEKVLLFAFKEKHIIEYRPILLQIITNELKIQNRIFIKNNKIYYCSSVSNDNILIGVFNIYKGYFIYEINICEVYKINENNTQLFKIYNNETCVDVNIIADNLDILNEKIHEILQKDKSIFSINIIDKYNDKYTIRIYNYN
ncbi:hypothetical protein AB837_00129 [bacterium AB1]|nr:hypothetical protein AB837_00129 [bacterium AB1]